MKTTALCLTFIVAIVACQPKNKQQTGATMTTAVVNDSAASLKKRPSPDTPRSAADRLIRALYFEHNTKENPFRETTDRTLVDQFFTKSTADLVWSNATKQAETGNQLKSNLLFNASDATVKKTWVLPAVVGGSRAFVYVTFEEKGKPEEIKIDMRQLNGRWRIIDIYYPGGKTLTQLLE